MFVDSEVYLLTFLYEVYYVEGAQEIQLFKEIYFRPTRRLRTRHMSFVEGYMYYCRYLHLRCVFFCGNLLTHKSHCLINGFLSLITNNVTTQRTIKKIIISC